HFLKAFQGPWLDRQPAVSLLNNSRESKNVIVSTMRIPGPNSSLRVTRTPTLGGGDEIRQVTLSSVICANHKWIQKLQPDSFSLPDGLTNVPVDCNKFHELDLSKCLDRGGCRTSEGSYLALGESGRTRPCTHCTCTQEGVLRCRAMVIYDCNEIADKYSPTEIARDLSCAVQCSSLLRQNK
ncbi:hypothetical protein OSTOST_21019, partial [Ostertagia ostertagi]